MGRVVGRTWNGSAMRSTDGVRGVGRLAAVVSRAPHDAYN
jgi:hypothetical protein